MEPNQDKNPEKRSVRFIEGKGFYIALVLCAAVIGVSAWSLLADTKTMDDERAHSAVLEVVPTPVVPVPETPQPTPELSPEPEIPAEEAAETAAQDVYLWPVDGAVTRAYAMTALAYDETMADWRTHDGVDILAQQGEVARRAGGIQRALERGGAERIQVSRQRAENERDCHHSRPKPGHCHVHQLLCP